MNKSAYAILGQDYSIVAVSKRIVTLKSNQSLPLVETGTIVIATIEKLAPGLSGVFVSWKSILNPRDLDHGICSVVPQKGTTEPSLRVGDQILLQVTQPATFGKLRVLSNQICLMTPYIVAWPGHHAKYLGACLPETPTTVLASPPLRGFTRRIPRPGSDATGPTRWLRQQYKIETDWERISLDFVKVKSKSPNHSNNINTSQLEWISWFGRPVAPSIIVKDTMMREYIAKCMIQHHPKVPRQFDIGNEHAWATWYGLHNAALTQPKVPLPCGGTLIIEATQTGWCIDVNSGTSLEIGSKGRANQEAMYGLIHQASIRSMHGSMIVDFIHEPNLACLEKILHTYSYLTQNDPYHTRIIYVSHDGFMRIIRNRIHQPL